MMNCQTTNNLKKIEPVYIPIPKAPVKPEIKFIDIETGLFLA